MMANSMKICLLEPYYGGSHRRWAEEYKCSSIHRIEILSLPPRHWKWRMHGAAVSFAGMLLESGKSYDLILANDLMDVAVFISLIREAGILTPVATYFHENQVTYPLSPLDTDTETGRDLHYGFINYTTALASKAVFFNSEFHRRSFVEALPGFLGRFPDHQNEETIARIRDKSRTLSLGLDLANLEKHKPEQNHQSGREPLLLWNHRWEFDKCPGEFLDILLALQERDLSFKVALLGQKFEEAEEGIPGKIRQLGDHVIHLGKVDDARAYAKWLWRADILPVTAIQDFFGGSVVEAVYCGCHPVLPRRLAYPEHFGNAPVFYETRAEAIDMLDDLITTGKWKVPSPLAERVKQYDWGRLAPVYDQAMSEI
jgi:glycosyltransferase involved in cell wall biosynthesis